METCWGAGTGFRDAASGCVFEVGDPRGRPELWERFLDGALAAYRWFGVEGALEYPAMRDGASTSCFIVGVAPGGEVVAGVRVLWPYSGLDEVHALRAWAGRAGEQSFRGMVEKRLADGIVETKAAWVDRRVRTPGLGAAVARALAHAAWLHGARYSLMTASEHAIARYAEVGVEVAAEVAPVAYPDQRYSTVPLWWDAESFRRRAVPEQVALIDVEREQLR